MQRIAQPRRYNEGGTTLCEGTTLYRRSEATYHVLRWCRKGMVWFHYHIKTLRKVSHESSCTCTGLLIISKGVTEANL